MNIPEQAIEAAAKALAELEPGEDWPSNIDLGGHALLGTRDDEYKWAMEQDAKRALQAALPHIRAQIAAEIRDMRVSDDGPLNQIHNTVIEVAAARIAEEGNTK